MRLHVEIHDGGVGPYLLLVHGFLSSRVQWAVNLDGLLGFCRPVVVELWGHGRSPAPETPETYTLKAYLEAFEDIRAGLGVERWCICGQSFGAGLTLNYALRHPDRVERQIFTNTVSALRPRDAESGAIRAMQEQATRIPTEGLDAIRALPFHPRYAKRFPVPVYKAMSEDADRIDPRAIVLAIEHTMPDLNVSDRFGETRVPTLLVNGRWEGRFQPLRHAAADTLPALQVVDLEGGHSINIEAAEAFNTAVRTFLA